jgi:hypothetical protein
MYAIEVLVAVQRDRASNYYKGLSAHKEYSLRLVTDLSDAFDALADRERRVDVFVLDTSLSDELTELVNDLRFTYPRLLIVLVDEDADFATPGSADEISTDPFTNDDLIRRINRLMADRRLETLRADVMPPVREFAKKLRKATGEFGKQQAAVTACREMGYDYVALYRVESIEPPRITLKAQDGPPPLVAAAPKQAGLEDIIGTVAKTGQTRTAGSRDDVNHPFVKRGKFGMVASVAVGIAARYGVLVACREQPESISGNDVMLLELVSAQLAAVISKEGSG